MTLGSSYCLGRTPDSLAAVPAHGVTCTARGCLEVSTTTQMSDPTQRCAPTSTPSVMGRADQALDLLLNCCPSGQPERALCTMALGPGRLFRIQNVVPTAVSFRLVVREAPLSTKGSWFMVAVYQCCQIVIELNSAHLFESISE